MNYLKNKKKIIVILLLLFLLTIPALLPLLREGFFLTDDGEWMIIRFSAFHQAFRDGQFPVRYLSRLNYGYGYPVANFLYPGFMYLAEFFKIMGFGFVNSVKIVIGLSLLGSTVFTFLWLAKRFSVYASAVASLVSLYIPYHLYDVYKRGSVGELLALAMFPFILWQIERKSFFWTTVGIAGLILSHNTLAILFLPITLFYMFIQSYGKNYIRKQLFLYGGIFFLGLGLSSFFWLPAIGELSYTRFSSINISDIEHYFAAIDLIGAGTLLIFGLSIFLITTVRKNKTESLLLLLFTLVSVVSIFYSSSFSRVIWEYLPVSFIQFPFRLLSYLIVSTSFITAYALTYFKGKAQFLLTGLIIIAVGYSVSPYMQPKEYFDKGEGFYSTNEDSTTVKNEYMPKWVKIQPKEHVVEKIVVLDTGGKITDEIYSNKKIIFSSSLPQDAVIRINTIYYPGWKAYIDDKETRIDYNNENGVMDIKLSKNQHKISVIFSETPFRLFADILSVVSFGVLVVVSLFKKNLWKQYHH